jgi:hypothetical protein
MIPVFGELDDFQYLFLLEITESRDNVLSLTVQEGSPLGDPISVNVAGVDLGPAMRIGSTDQSRIFKIVWTQYVGYSVINESYALPDDSEVSSGGHFRLYSKSRFLDYVARATFACGEYPGPLRHWWVATENQIINVVSVKDPEIRQVGASPHPIHVH